MNNSNKQTSSSSGQPISFSDKIFDAWQLLQNKLCAPVSFRDLLDSVEEYAHYSESYAEKPLNQAKILEIGFGARPYRLIYLMSLGMDIVGVDLDRPSLAGKPAELVSIYCTNGLERCFCRFECPDWTRNP